LRLLTLVLSITTLALFGRALAGLGGFLFGKGRVDYILQGILLGFLAMGGGFWAWRRYLRELENEPEPGEEDDTPSS